MRDHGALLRQFGRELREPACNIFERETVEAVAPQSFRLELMGYRKAARRRSERMVEGGIEAGDLDELRTKRPDGADRRQAAGLVQRRKRRQGRKRRQHVGVELNRAREIGSAMHDTVSDRAQTAAAEISFEPGQHAAHAVNFAF